jgi:transposase
MLVPTLSPGDVVVFDNLGGHKGVAARKAIRKAGAHLLFLPPYSPDLNPIEMVFAKLKTLLRKAAERTVEATGREVGSLPQPIHTSRVPKLPPPRWILRWIKLITKDSNRFVRIPVLIDGTGHDSLKPDKHIEF